MFTIIGLAAGGFACFTALLGFTLSRAAALREAAAVTLNPAQPEERSSVA